MYRYLEIYRASEKEFFVFKRSMTDYDNYRGGHYGDTGYYNSRFLLYSNYSLK